MVHKLELQEQAFLTNQEQVEADSELIVFRDKRLEWSCGGCLPNFVQRHEYKIREQ